MSPTAHLSVPSSKTPLCPPLAHRIVSATTAPCCSHRGSADYAAPAPLSLVEFAVVHGVDLIQGDKSKLRNRVKNSFLRYRYLLRLIEQFPSETHYHLVLDTSIHFEVSHTVIYENIRKMELN